MQAIIAGNRERSVPTIVKASMQRLIKLTSLCLVIAPMLGLAACESSSRFGDFSGGRSRPVSPEPLVAAPTPRVESAPLAPPPGTAVSPQPGQVTIGANDGLNPQPGMNQPGMNQPGMTPGQPGMNQPGMTPGQPGMAQPGMNQPGMNPPGQPRVAALPKVEESVPKAPTRTGVTGNWTLTEAAGGHCRATLSSAPALDLYKASTSGCKTKEMQRVTAWELRGNAVYLYEAGGAVAAKLQQANGGFSGATAKSGAPITLSK